MWQEFKSKGGKSAHDLAADPRLSHVAGDITDMPPPSSSPEYQQAVQSVRDKLEKYNQDNSKPGSSKTAATEDREESSKSSKMWVIRLNSTDSS